MTINELISWAGDLDVGLAALWVIGGFVVFWLLALFFSMD